MSGTAAVWQEIGVWVRASWSEWSRKWWGGGGVDGSGIWALWRMENSLGRVTPLGKWQRSLVNGAGWVRVRRCRDGVNCG
ncbi:hypothetical protein M0R45_006412 [Rubus argutus]|uniref:Uncharacterized protein n=1 Tax=Rubus argutus TaxID=59490 RepID=A0AAW1YQX8_RUBAR